MNDNLMRHDKCGTPVNITTEQDLICPKCNKLMIEPQSCNHRPDMWGDCMECHQPAEQPYVRAEGICTEKDIIKPTPEQPDGQCRQCDGSGCVACSAKYLENNDKESSEDELVECVFCQRLCPIDIGGKGVCDKCSARAVRLAEENNDKEWDWEEKFDQIVAGNSLPLFQAVGSNRVNMTSRVKNFIREVESQAHDRGYEKGRTLLISGCDHEWKDTSEVNYWECRHCGAITYP